VIALATRNLPPELKRKAIFLGALTAVGLRVVLTIFVVQLLAFPILKFIGGALLLKIAYDLALEEQDDGEGIDGATTLRSAIRTIVLADVVMSLDNVLAVAGVAKGDWVLIILGLAISIPIVVYGSTLLSWVIHRLPIVVWIGAALIAYVGVELMITLPWLEHRLEGMWGLSDEWFHRLIAIAGGLLVTGIALLRKRARSRKSRLMVEGPASDD